MTPEEIARLRRSAAMAPTMPTTIVGELLDEVERLQALIRRRSAGAAPVEHRTNDEVGAAIAAAIERRRGT